MAANERRIILKNTTTFIVCKDLVSIDGDDDLVLRKGFLHINEITIDKKDSSKEFLKTFNQLLQEKRLILDDTHEVYDDFMKLVRFGIIDIESKTNFLVTSNDGAFDLLNSLDNENFKLSRISDIFSEEDLRLIDCAGSSEKGHAIMNEIAKKLEGYDHIYYFDQFSNLARLRRVNKLIYNLNLEYTFCIYDKENIYMMGVMPKYSGCFSCLEKHIISKFPGTFDEYSEKFNLNPSDLSDTADLMMLVALMLRDMKNIAIYGMSTLTGNVIHFQLSNFEYNFNSNRKSTMCPICSGINNVRFEEQNIRGINIIKDLNYD